MRLSYCTRHEKFVIVTTSLQKCLRHKLPPKNWIAHSLTSRTRPYLFLYDQLLLSYLLCSPCVYHRSSEFLQVAGSSNSRTWLVQILFKHS